MDGRAACPTLLNAMTSSTNSSSTTTWPLRCAPARRNGNLVTGAVSCAVAFVGAAGQEWAAQLRMHVLTW